jgi:hypothetical protein
MSYSTNGQPAGFTVDLLQAIAGAMGMKPTSGPGHGLKCDALPSKIDMTLGMSIPVDREGFRLHFATYHCTARHLRPQEVAGCQFS